MPQREFWTAVIPTEFVVRYQIDPRRPEEPPSVSITVMDQASAVIERASCRLPYNVLHEAMAAVMGAAWEAYLFGELGGIQRAIAPVVKAWRIESASRPLWQ